MTPTNSSLKRRRRRDLQQQQSLYQMDPQRRPRRNCSRSLQQAGTPRSMSTDVTLLAMLLLSLLALLCRVTEAYRVGEPVETDVRIIAGGGGGPGYLFSASSSITDTLTDALRGQMPLFGVTSTAQFRIRDDKDTPEDGWGATTTTTFALQFEDGLQAIPATPLMNGSRQLLDRIQVSFVYSRSSGIIHSVSCTSVDYERREKYDLHDLLFRVDYVWIEEEAPYTASGLGVMFFSVFVVSIVFLVQTCGITDDIGDVGDYEDDYDQGVSQAVDEYAGTVGGAYPSSAGAYASHKHWS